MGYYFLTFGPFSTYIKTNKQENKKKKKKKKKNIKKIYIKRKKNLEKKSVNKTTTWLRIKDNKIRNIITKEIR